MAQLKRAKADTPAHTELTQRVTAVTAEVSTNTAARREVAEELKECYGWKTAGGKPLDLMLPAAHLFTGGDGRVAARRRDTGQQVWDAAVDGRAYGLAAADGRLFVSTDRGHIHCFAGSR